MATKTARLFQQNDVDNDLVGDACDSDYDT